MFTKEQLLAMGVSEADAVKLLAALDEGYVAKDTHETVVNQLDTEKQKVVDRDNTINTLSKFKGTAEDLTNEVTRLTQDLANKDAEHKANLEKVQKVNAVKFELVSDKEYVPHNVDMVIGLLDFEKITVDDKGKVTGLTEQVKPIRENNGFLFTAPQQPEGQGNKPFAWQVLGTPPKDGDKGGNTDTSESFGKALAQNKLSSLGIKPANNPQ